MELRQLRYFVAVAEEKNFVVAAKRLHVSQPPITRQIRKLEEELGVELLRRTNKGTELTAPGAAFLEDARRILAQVSRSIDRTQAAGRGELGTLDVGYFGSPIYSLLPQLLRDFRRRLPTVDVALHRMGKEQQLAALKLGELHLGFGRYFPPDPEIVNEEILREDLVVAVPDDARRFETIEELFSALPLVLFPGGGRPNFADNVLNILHEHGVEPRIAAVTEDVRSALTQTAIGLGATVVPRSVCDLRWVGVRFEMFGAFDQACPLSCVYKASELSPLLLPLLQTIREFADAEKAAGGKRSGVGASD